MNAFRIDGHDLQRDGWVLVQVGRWLSAAPTQRATTALPDLAGVLPDDVITTEVRAIPVRLRWRGDRLSDRQGAYQLLKDLLRGTKFVQFPDGDTRIVRAVASAPEVFPAKEMVPFAVPTIEVAFTLWCYDGASYAQDGLILALATTPVAVPLGDAPSPAILRWGGSWSTSTARTFTLRDFRGVSRHVLTITTPSSESLGSTDHLEVDIIRQYLTKVSSGGTRTFVDHWLTSTSWPVFDPAYQDRVNQCYATAEISAGTAQLQYRLAYEF